MAKAETEITNEILVKTAEKGSFLFRNVRGLFLTLDGKRKISAGLQAPDSADCIGITPVLITKDMVGMTLGVFTSIEVKTFTGSLKTGQAKWRDFILSKGGFAGVARSAQDAINIIKK